jgi:hypothetical protein
VGGAGTASLPEALGARCIMITCLPASPHVSHLNKHLNLQRLQA